MRGAGVIVAAAMLAAACAGSDEPPASSPAPSIGADSTVVDSTSPTTSPVVTDPVSTDPVPVPTMAADELPSYARQGLFVPGHTDLVVNGLPITVWFPAIGIGDAVTYGPADLLPPDQAARVSPFGAWTMRTAAVQGLSLGTDGPAPLVVISHGYAGHRFDTSFLATHLATWGFIVAAPQHRDRDLAAVVTRTAGTTTLDDAAELRAVIELFTTADASLGALRRSVDPERIAVIGIDAGGQAAMRLASDPIIDTYITLGGAARLDATYPDTPSLFVGGTRDALVAFGSVQSTYDEAPAPKRLVEIDGATHLSFTDLCGAENLDGSPLPPIADAVADAELGVDAPEILSTIYGTGCEEGTASGPAGWAPIRQVVVAHLRNIWGIDAFPVGLGDELSRFDGIAVTFTEQ